MAKEPRKGWAECFKKVNEEQYKEIVSIVFNTMDDLRTVDLTNPDEREKDLLALSHKIADNLMNNATMD